MSQIPRRIQAICHTRGSGYPRGSLYGSLLSQGQVWIPASAGTTKKSELGPSRLEVDMFLEPLAFKARGDLVYCHFRREFLLIVEFIALKS